MGPRAALTFGRRRQASADLVKAALTQPKRTERSAEKKNLERNALGERTGRVHMSRQDLSNVAVARLKGLKRRRTDAAAHSEDGDGDGDGEGAGHEGKDAGADADGAAQAPKRVRKGLSGPGGFGPNRGGQQASGPQSGTERG